MDRNHEHQKYRRQSHQREPLYDSNFTISDRQSNRPRPNEHGRINHTLRDNERRQADPNRRHELDEQSSCSRSSHKESRSRGEVYRFVQSSSSERESTSHLNRNRRDPCSTRTTGFNDRFDWRNAASTETTAQCSRRSESIGRLSETKYHVSEEGKLGREFRHHLDRDLPINELRSRFVPDGVDGYDETRETMAKFNGSRFTHDVQSRARESSSHVFFGRSGGCQNANTDERSYDLNPAFSSPRVVKVHSTATTEPVPVAARQSENLFDKDGRCGASKFDDEANVKVTIGVTLQGSERVVKINSMNDGTNVAGPPRGAFHVERLIKSRGVGILSTNVTEKTLVRESYIRDRTRFDDGVVKSRVTRSPVEERMKMSARRRMDMEGQSRGSDNRQRDADGNSKESFSKKRDFSSVRINTWSSNAKSCDRRSAAKSSRTTTPACAIGIKKSRNSESQMTGGDLIGSRSKEKKYKLSTPELINPVRNIEQDKLGSHDQQTSPSKLTSNQPGTLTKMRDSRRKVIVSQSRASDSCQRDVGGHSRESSNKWDFNSRQKNTLSSNDKSCSRKSEVPSTRTTASTCATGGEKSSHSETRMNSGDQIGFSSEGSNAKKYKLSSQELITPHTTMTQDKLTHYDQQTSLSEAVSEPVTSCLKSCLKPMTSVTVKNYCELCECRFTIPIDEHERSQEHETNKMLLRRICTDCKQSFDRPSDYEVHRTLVHKSAVPLAVINGDSDNSVRYLDAISDNEELEKSNVQQGDMVAPDLVNWKEKLEHGNVPQSSQQDDDWTVEEIPDFIVLACYCQLCGTFFHDCDSLIHLHCKSKQHLANVEEKEKTSPCNNL